MRGLFKMELPLPLSLDEGRTLIYAATPDTSWRSRQPLHHRQRTTDPSPAGPGPGLSPWTLAELTPAVHE